LKALFSEIDTLVVFVAVYSVFLIVSATTTAFNSISMRLLSPIYVPVIAGLLSFLQKAAEMLGRHVSPKKNPGGPDSARPHGFLAFSGLDDTGYVESNRPWGRGV
jgi:hypothetical protein